MTKENCKRPICLSEFLKKSNEFRVHTGNIGQWGDLKLRTFINPSEELVECLRLQLEKWTPDESLVNGNDFCLCTSPWCQPVHGLAQYSRDELKITVKVFMSNADAESVKKCVLEIKKELQVTPTFILLSAQSRDEKRENTTILLRNYSANFHKIAPQ